MESLIYKEEYYRIVGICMEVHRILGKGLLEIIYKDAIEYELDTQKIPHEKEKEYPVEYKGIILPHKFYADFVIYNNIILEIKAVNDIIDEHLAQTLNYMALAKSPLGIIVNFGASSLQHKRVILSDKKPIRENSKNLRQKTEQSRNIPIDIDQKNNS